jgi:ABC-type uncharacterized transport system permease subunit
MLVATCPGPVPWATSCLSSCTFRLVFMQFLKTHPYIIIIIIIIIIITQDYTADKAIGPGEL